MGTLNRTCIIIIIIIITIYSAQISIEMFKNLHKDKIELT